MVFFGVKVFLLVVRELFILGLWGGLWFTLDSIAWGVDLP